MLDAQLARLADVLRLNRIWAANVGENFDVSQDAWQDFARALPDTAVAHLFVEEGNLVGTDLKRLVRCRFLALGFSPGILPKLRGSLLQTAVRSQVCAWQHV